MKTNKTIFILVILLSAFTSWSQGFVNLSFDNSKLTNLVISGFPTTVAIVTGWSVNTVNPATGDNNTLPYNDSYLDGAGSSLEGTNNPYGPSTIQGKYSVYMQGGTVFAQNTTNGASIWQTGTIPVSSLSLTYWGGPLTVSFGGQALAFGIIGNGSGYAVWGADISAYAGQTGELRFTVPWQSNVLLDNIQFSSTAVPEPGTQALAALGGLLFGLRSWKKLSP